MCLFYVHIYAKLQNFIQLSPTSTMLCHIEHNRFVNFCISLDKCEKLQYFCSNTTDLYKI